MKKYSELEIQQIVEAADFEQRNREFKPPFSWMNDNYPKECVIRAVLGLSNTPSGGQVIVGIDEDNQHRPVLTGLTDVQVSSFESYDPIKGAIDSFSTVSINYEIGWGEFTLQEGSVIKLVIFTVSEFDELPTICKRNGTSDKLRFGDLYVRAKKGSAGTIRVSENEMGEIIRMATDKGIADMKSRGYIVDASSVKLEPITSDLQRFREQIADLSI